MAPHDQDRLNALEHESVYVLREAFRRFHNIAMAWNGGKDAAVLLWLARRAFFGHVPFPIVYVDTGYGLPQVIDYRDRMARESNLQLVIASNEEGLASGVTFPNGRASRDACCALLKRDALQQVVERRHYTAVVVGLRRDDGGLCAEETFFSPRGAAGADGGERPVELFDQFASTFAPHTHVRVHPLLRWTEEEVWAYIEREQVPLAPSYFDAGAGRRYRSVDCGPCITAVASRARTVADIRAEHERGSGPDRGTRIPGAGFAAPAISRREVVTASLDHPTAIPDPSGAFRFVVQDVYRFDHRRIVAGRIESGTLRVGDRLQFLPEGKHSTVLALERWNHPSQSTASAGDSIGLTLADQIRVDRGDVASRAEDVPRVASEFSAHVFWLGDPLTVGRSYSCRLATQEFDVDIATATADADEGAIVTLRSRQPVALDAFTRVPRLGRFVVLDGPRVRGAGVVLNIGPEVAPVAADRLIVRSVSQVSRDARHARNGHKGGVVWFTGLSGSGKSTLATGLERELFTRGRQAFVLDGDNVRFGLSADLGFSARDRAENIRRVAEVAKLFAEAGLIAITAFISPYRSDRLRARQIMQQEGLTIPFAEVYLNTPLDVCEQRDPKRLYARARAGELKEFTGISSPFEAPDRPELTIDTSTVDLDEALALLLQDLNRRVMF